MIVSYREGKAVSLSVVSLGDIPKFKTGLCISYGDNKDVLERLGTPMETYDDIRCSYIYRLENGIYQPYQRALSHWNKITRNMKSEKEKFQNEFITVLFEYNSDNIINRVRIRDSFYDYYGY